MHYFNIAWTFLSFLPPMSNFCSCIEE